MPTKPTYLNDTDNAPEWTPDPKRLAKAKSMPVFVSPNGPADWKPIGKPKRYTFQVDPVAASRARVGRFGAYYQPKYANFKEEMGREARRVLDGVAPSNKHLMVRMEFRKVQPGKTKLAVPSPDVDNFMKAAMDGLNGVLWEDDKQIVSASAFKTWVNHHELGSIVVEIQEVEVPMPITE
jgi:hypothetical protein